MGEEVKVDLEIGREEADPGGQDQGGERAEVEADQEEENVAGLEEAVGRSQGTERDRRVKRGAGNLKAKKGARDPKAGKEVRGLKAEKEVRGPKAKKEVKGLKVGRGIENLQVKIGGGGPKVKKERDQRAMSGSVPRALTNLKTIKLHLIKEVNKKMLLTVRMTLAELNPRV